MNEQEILAEMGSVMDRIAALPADAFAERHPLIERQAELRTLLATAQVEAGRNATEAWAEQAGSKKQEGDKPFIVPVLPDSSGSVF